MSDRNFIIDTMIRGLTPGHRPSIEKIDKMGDLVADMLSTLIEMRRINPSTTDGVSAGFIYDGIEYHIDLTVALPYSLSVLTGTDPKT